MFKWLKKRPPISVDAPADQEAHLRESRERLTRALAQRAEVDALTDDLTERNRDHYIERLEQTYGRPLPQ